MVRVFILCSINRAHALVIIKVEDFIKSRFQVNVANNMIVVDVIAVNLKRITKISLSKLVVAIIL